jgi:TonB family protein
MKLLTGKRIGQSGSELATAVSFSLFLHAVVFLGALYLSFHLSARFVVPAYYRVNLVGLPADVPLTAPAAPASAPEPKAALKPKPAPASKVKQPAVRAVPKSAPAPKEAMPELPAAKRKPEKAAEVPAAPTAPAAGTAGKKQEAVSLAVAEGGQSFPFAPYVAIVRDKVERNWNPPPGAKGLKARVTFNILRSGRVGDARLVEASGNFYFDQAAMRAILASSPFPELPESFFQDYEMFSVDLMERD